MGRMPDENALRRSQLWLQLQIIAVFLLCIVVLWSNRSILDAFTVGPVRPGSLAIIILCMVTLYSVFMFCRQLYGTRLWPFVFFIPLMLALWPLDISEIRPFQTIDTVTRTVHATPSQVNEQTRRIEQAIFAEVNQKRNEEGKRPLHYSDDLARLALLHSLDQVQHDYIRHEDAKGRGPTQRAELQGISIRRATSAATYVEGIGENIGRIPIGYVLGIGNVTRESANVAAAQLLSWMSSPQHAQNILSEDYADTGIGVVYDEEKDAYVTTQNFR